MKATQLSPEIIKGFLYYLIRIKWRRAYAFVRGQNGFMQLFNFARMKSKIGKLLVLYIADNNQLTTSL